VVNLREAFAAFSEEVRWLIPFERAVMLLLDDEERLVEPYATYPEEAEPGAPVPLAGSAAIVPVHAGSAVSIRPDDPRYRHLDWSIFGEEAQEVAAVPVRQGPRTAAVFALVHSANGGYANSDLDALEEVAGLLGVTIERLRLYESAEHSAKHDLMTGLPNYRYLQERLHELRAGISEPGESALMMIDMDSLKVFNDTLGHEAGDRAIQVVAREIRGACRDSDFVARTGGDEFVVVMEGADADAALIVAQRIHEALADAHLDVPGAPTRLAVSIGVACAPEDTDSTHDLLHLADEAMYAAKFNGGQRTSMARAREDSGVSRGLQTRSTRIMETMTRAALSGASSAELAASALAQRWGSAVVLRLGYPAEIAGPVRLLTALEASSRLASPRNDRDRSTARYFLGRLRADWLSSADHNALNAVGVLVPSLVSVAWVTMPRPEGEGLSASEAFARVSERYRIDTSDPAWRLFSEILMADESERRQTRAA
jgi:diguanylate cyclase (GGDEF)-like protein